MEQTLTSLFKTAEEWNAFLELRKQFGSIHNEWYKKLQTSLAAYFAEDDVRGWGFEYWNTYDMSWFLSDFGNRSIKLLLGWGGEFNLHVDPSKHNVKKINVLMKNEEYKPLLNAFRVDIFPNNDYERIIIEQRNYTFNDSFGMIQDSEMLAWYAGNKTDEYVAQIAEKVNRIRKNEELSNLLYSLNKETQIGDMENSTT
jgi:hypothetical protein